MPFTLIKETFKPDVGRPDGDTIRFSPDNNLLLYTLKRRGRMPAFNQNNNTISLRYQGIDAMETRALQPESRNATQKNLELLGITDSQCEATGYILSD